MFVPEFHQYERTVAAWEHVNETVPSHTDVRTCFLLPFHPHPISCRGIQTLKHHRADPHNRRSTWGVAKGLESRTMDTEIDCVSNA